MYNILKFSLLLAILTSCKSKSNYVNSERPEIVRNMEWGEHYYDVEKKYNSLENTFDIASLEQLFNRKFDVRVPYYLNDIKSLRVCKVPYRDQVYCVSEPTYQGSFNSSIFVYEFVIFNNDSMKEEVSFSMMFNYRRELISIAVRGGKIGSTKQTFVKRDTPDPSIQLASSVKSSVRRAIQGDDHDSDWYNLLPNFIEKFIIAIDDNVIRNSERQGVAPNP